MSHPAWCVESRGERIPVKGVAGRHLGHVQRAFDERTSVGDVGQDAAGDGLHDGVAGDTMTAFTAEAGSASHDGLTLLASGAATLGRTHRAATTPTTDRHIP